MRIEGGISSILGAKRLLILGRDASVPLQGAASGHKTRKKNTHPHITHTLLDFGIINLALYELM